MGSIFRDQPNMTRPGRDSGSADTLTDNDFVASHVTVEAAIVGTLPTFASRTTKKSLTPKTDRTMMSLM